MGNLLWELPYGRKWDNSFDQSRSTPTIEDGRIYVSSGLGDLACVDSKTASIIWKKESSDQHTGTYGKWGISESLLIVDDLVLYTPGGPTTTMVAYDKYSGDLVWATESLNDDPSYVSPILIDNDGIKQIVNVSENYVFSVSPDDGRILWKFNFGVYGDGEKRKKNNQTNTPLFKNGELFITSGYNHKSVKIKIDQSNENVHLMWVDSLLDVHHGGVVELDGYIYGANWINNRDGNWTCLEWDSGRAMYSTEWENKGSIISADGMLYCYDEKDGNIALVPVDPTKFEVISSFKVPYGKGPHWSHPVIDQGILYIRHGNALMAYRLKK